MSNSVSILCNSLPRSASATPEYPSQSGKLNPLPTIIWQRTFPVFTATSIGAFSLALLVNASYVLRSTVDHLNNVFYQVMGLARPCALAMFLCFIFIDQLHSAIDTGLKHRNRIRVTSESATLHPQRSLCTLSIYPVPLSYQNT